MTPTGRSFDVSLAARTTTTMDGHIEPTLNISPNHLSNTRAEALNTTASVTDTEGL